jgi:uncharacterized zinc-type alcohol dehydrogenase-like protein
MTTKSYAALSPTTPLVPFHFERRALREHDVLIDILYCGVCHSDIHQARDEWGGSMFPMVPGHEIVGRVSGVGSKVTKFKVGDIAGVGCMVDSCRRCESCHENLEQFCEHGRSYTYNDLEQDKKTPTMGGYSSDIVVDEAFTLKISPELDLARVAPLLCAGITTYSPLRYWKVQQGSRVGVMGLGGLGHMAVKLAKAMGAHVTLFTTSPSKKDDALALGADEVVISTDEKSVSAHLGKLDVIINTLGSNKYDIGLYLNKLKRDGVMAIVGLPAEPISLGLGNIIAPRRKIAGSLIGGLAETQEMLDFCAKHNIFSDIELISIQNINKAYERVLKSDVKYRFVIDMKSLG